MPPPPNRLLNFVAFTLTSALQPALKLVLLPIFAALLGPDGMGRIAYIDAVLLFIAAVSVVGLHHFFLRNYHHLDRDVLFATLTKFLLFHNGVILALCLWAALAFDHPTERLCFALACVTNFLSVFLVLPLRELRLQERALRYGATYAALAVAQTLAALLFVSFGFGPTGWFVGHLAAMVPFAAYYGAKTLPRLRTRLHREMLADALRLGIALSISAFGMMAVGIADRIQLKEMTTYDQVGLYSVGYGLGIGVSVVTFALYTTFEPVLYRYEALNDDFSRGFSQRFSLSYIAVTVLSTTVIVLIEPIGSALLEPEFYAALPITQIVALCGIYGLCHLYFTLVGVRLQSKRLLAIATCGAAAFNVLANLVLIPVWGILGAAYATFGAYFAMTAFYSLIIWRVPRLRRLYFASLGVPLLILSGIVVERFCLDSRAMAVPVFCAIGGVVLMARIGNLPPWGAFTAPSEVDPA